MEIGSLISSILQQYQTTQTTQQAPKQMNGSDMYQQLRTDLGLDSSEDITQDKIADLIEDIESGESTQDKGKLGFLKQLMQNFDEIAGEDGVISEVEMTNNIDLLKPPEGGPPPGGNMFSQMGNNMYNWMDLLDLTEEDITPPIDLRV